MKNVILELFDQQRQLNTRLLEMQKLNEEKEQSIAMLTQRIDELIAQTQQDAGSREAALDKERQWEKERESFKKTISDLQDLIRLLKADKSRVHPGKNAVRTLIRRMVTTKETDRCQL